MSLELQKTPTAQPRVFDAETSDGPRSRGLENIYPVTLAQSLPAGDVLSLYLVWLETLGLRFQPERSPWLPVGRLGPLLMLGNCAPLFEAPLFPSLSFQPVLLGEEDYARLLEHCVAALPRHRGQQEFLKPCGKPGHVLGRPGNRAEALDLLLGCFPRDSALEETLRPREGMVAEEEPTLPLGYEQALHHLQGLGGVADLSHLESPPSLLAKMPPRLPRTVFPLALRGSRVWLAAPKLPQPQLEDQLLNELGEGWSVQFVLSAEPQAEDAAGKTRETGAGQTSEPRGERPRRISIDATPTGPSGMPLSQGRPGEIRLGTRELAELASYDPRRADRDPSKVFLRALSEAIREGASDLHIEPGLERTRVRARIDGVLEEWLEMSMEFGQALVGSAKELLGLSAEKFLPQDGSCTVRFGADSVSLRVSSYPIRRRRQKLVLRFLPRRGRVPPLDDLLPSAEAGLLRRAASAPSGLILVCGPTGSGKTTTVFSTLAELNTVGRNITTMEDPVEYEIEGLNQAELDPHRGVAWEPLLKGFLRQDPDVAMLGEIRDRVTAETAIRQALTGHLVFATLHTLSCARTVDRLIDMGVNPELLSSALTLVVSQRLVRRLCPVCRMRGEPGPEQARLFEHSCMPVPRHVWSPRASGCPSCRHGYKGRTAVFEFLPVTRALSEMIEKRSGRSAYSAWAGSKGFRSLHSAALDLAARGITSIEEAAEWRDVWEDYPWGS